MFSRYGSRLFLALLLLGGVFLLANTFVVALLSGGPAHLSPQTTRWGFGLVLALVLGVPALLLILGWFWRPYRQLVAFARQARGLTGDAEKPEEANFVLETFRLAVGQLQAQRSELARLHAQETVRAASAERLSAHIVASVPSALVAFDAQGRATLLNSPAHRLLEAPEDATGLDWRVLLRRAPHLAALVEECLQHKTLHQREEVLLRHSDGQQRRLGASVGPLEDGNGGVLCLFTDLTEVTQLREQLTLKKNLENLGEMSAGLAHEFKNALAALQSYAQLLQNNELPPTAQLATEGLLDEVQQLSEMVTSFLNFARPHPLQLGETSLRELLEDCAEELRPLYQEKRVELVFNGAFPLVRADERMLRQAFANLLRNAVEAIHEEMPVRRVTVCGTLENAPDRACVTIADTGPGIAPEIRDALFTPFFSTKRDGRGLGLTVVREVFDAHGFDYGLESRPEGGAELWVRM